MISHLYRRYSDRLLLCCLILLPVVYICGEQVPSNNDIETWLPRNSEVRQDYDRFCRTFGADETILVAFGRPFPELKRLQAAARRLDGLAGVESCWTRHDVMQAMVDNSVGEEVAAERLEHLLASPNQSLETMLISINEIGCQDRSAVVAEIRQQLEYCGLREAVFAGGPVVGTRLSELGNRKNASLLFGLTLLICFGLLHWNIGCWKTSSALMLANVFGIELTLSSLWVSGQDMNFIMSCLPVMVMVFTTAAAIHFMGHFRREYPDENAIGHAMQAVIRPSAFATVTTVIGLVSLAASDVGPIPAFGVAAAIGTLFSFVVGVLLTPAIIVGISYVPPKQKATEVRLEQTAMFIVNRPWRVLIPGVLITAFCAIGVSSLRARISPLDFLPNSDPVLEDTLLIQRELTSPSSIEAVVDFREGQSFAERLRRVRDIENRLAGVDNVCHVLSLADFFPEELSENTLTLSRLAAAASGQRVSGLIADGHRMWRISIRLVDDEPAAIASTMNTLQAEFSDSPIVFTGLAPLMQVAQGQIFDGFWRSFASAFVLITIVMVFALRSLTAGLVAMIPNLTPILLVFGTLGWCDVPIDIGIMMTASIALGLAVDGTFHFLFSYQEVRNKLGCRYRGVRAALLNTGMPIISSAVISGTGLLALGFSPFKPTMRFGVLMFLLLIAALVGDLLLLPAFLAVGARRKQRRNAAASHPPERHSAAA